MEFSATTQSLDVRAVVLIGDGDGVVMVMVMVMATIAQRLEVSFRAEALMMAYDGVLW